MKYLSVIILTFILSACANVSMPTGGPRDKTPPELIASTPYANQKNFTDKTLELTFNEDIKLKDPKEEILIIPTLGKKTLFTAKKRKLFIEPELPWLPNTTYNINFRDAVQDLTEGNPAENLRLAFSTGPTIDSLSISGTVKEIFTEKIPTKITVALYQSDTFDIYKHTPTYFTKSDKEGHYDISNLKSSIYYLYAFEDKNKNLRVDSKTEKFGYLNKSIDLQSPQDSLEIPMLQVDSRPLTLTNVRHTDKTSRVRFNKALDSLTITGITNNQSIYTYGSDQTELIFYNSFPEGDSIKITLNATDSVSQKMDTIFYIKHGEIKTTPETLKTKEIEIKYDIADRKMTYQLSYNKPIAIINTDSIYIRYDTINTIPVELKNILIDTLRNRITIKANIEETVIDEKEKKKPQLIIGKGAFISIENDTTKTITKPIRILKEEDLGLVSVKIETTKENYILQLTTNDNQIEQSLINVKEYTFKHLEPKEYKLRIIVDTNGNGKWDAGNFYKKVEPEKIIQYKSDEGKYSFPLRANWEYGPLLIKF